MHRTVRFVLAVSALTLLVAACGSTDNGAVGTGATDGGAPRTVKIEMRDIAYVPNSVDVRRGETVRFVFTNKGAVAHDAFIGDKAAQDAHEMEMRDLSSTSMAGSSGSGTESNGITVEPGATGELTYTFDGAGEVLIGCHQTGHYAAGMKLALNAS